MQNQFIKLSIPLFCAISCANHQPLNNYVVKDSVAISNTLSSDSFPKGTLIKNITCKNNASQSYALYIPSIINKHLLPVIYFFDPHADGSLPLIKYKSLAKNLVSFLSEVIIQKMEMIIHSPKIFGNIYLQIQKSVLILILHVYMFAGFPAVQKLQDISH